VDQQIRRFETRSAAEWLAEAEHFERMAEKFRENVELHEGFLNLAANARKRSGHPDE